MKILKKDAIDVVEIRFVKGREVADKGSSWPGQESEALLIARNRGKDRRDPFFF